MVSRSNEERLDRLEQAVQVLAEDQKSSKDDIHVIKHAVVELATVTQKQFEAVAMLIAEQARQADVRMTRIEENINRLEANIDRLESNMDRLESNMDRQEADNAAMAKQTDARIGNLVSAVGELIRRLPPANLH